MIRRKPSRRKGTTLVESAFLINILMVILLGIIEHSQVVLLRQVMSNAAREGTRLAATSTGTKTTNEIQAAVTSYMAGVNASNVTIIVDKVNSSGTSIGAWSDAGYGEGIRVRIDANYIPFVPMFSQIPNPLPMTTQYIAFSESD